MKGLSGVQGNRHAPFLGGGGTVMFRCYPTQGRLIKLLRVEPPKRSTIRARARECVICRRSLLALAVFRNVASGNSQRSLGPEVAQAIEAGLRVSFTDGITRTIPLLAAGARRIYYQRAGTGFRCQSTAVRQSCPHAISDAAGRR
ncbi:hypothetical protein DF058_34750 [Burkholderia cenocepacia]|nr:hypothetical protein DF058_34750 [Burkholderia cenocepacia]RRA03077.1 hypothetical protein DF059_34790 [Burkholderia cenocepacia]